MHQNCMLFNKIKTNTYFRKTGIKCNSNMGISNQSDLRSNIAPAPMHLKHLFPKFNDVLLMFYSNFELQINS